MCALVDSWMGGLKKAPQLYTNRLSLRAMHAGDFSDIQYHVNTKAVCDNLSYTPHPYTMEMAENWMRNVNYGMNNGTCCYWSICDRATGEFIGSMGISIFREQDGSEIHYWIGEKFWNKGYCTEASKRTIKHVFDDLKLHRLQITHRKENVGSRRVVEKCGFVFEGEFRDELKRFGAYENVVHYSMLADEFFKLKEEGRFD
ncbi:MAG: GNAT family N-acetyltransferase [Puniceicoccales bacterium]|nr:GNAT family N-acetyltransferase [Puniceicoccales bacterium]